MFLTKGMSIELAADNPRNVLLQQDRGLKCVPIDIPDKPLPPEEPGSTKTPFSEETPLSEIVEFPSDVIERLGATGFHTVGDIIAIEDDDDLLAQLCEIKGIGESRATQLIDACREVVS